MKSAGFIRVAACLAMSAAVPAAVAGIEADPVRAEMVADREAIRPGESFTLGVVFRMDEGWHIYWRNPGAAGLPTRVEWSLPEGFEAGPLQWPAPLVFREDGLPVFGYGDGAAILATVRAPGTFDGHGAVLRARVEWLTCGPSCIPGVAELQLRLRAAEPGEPPRESPAAGRLRAQAARVPAESRGWTYAVRGRSVRLFPPEGFDVSAWPSALFLPTEQMPEYRPAVARWSSGFLGSPRYLVVRIGPDPVPDGVLSGVLLRGEREPRGAIGIRAGPRTP